MKTDFEKLKKLCDENGFELITESPDENDKFFVVKKKDIWEGVEFCKVAKIHKVYRIDADKIYFANNRTETWALKEKCTPSTEQAYVEQLKKEVFERFGEIKEGDRFDRSNIDRSWEPIWDVSCLDLNYDKDLDRLYIGNLGIYQQGKWAERVKERVKVDPSNVRDVLNKLQDCVEDDKDKFIKFLAEQLEKYLNNEL